MGIIKEVDPNQQFYDGTEVEKKYFLSCGCDDKIWSEYGTPKFCPNCGEKIIEKEARLYFHIYYEGDKESEYISLSDLRKLLESTEK